MPSLYQHARRIAGGLKREAFPTRERALLQRLERSAFRYPRYTPGHVAAGPYRIEYADAMSVWPQWDDIFLHDVLAFDTQAAAPRIIDCGANVGIASLYYKRRYPRARITAFEADPQLAAICRRNLEGNGSADVEVLASAAWITDGEVEFVAEGSDSGAIAALEPSVNGRRVVVPTARLRRWLDETIDLLKIDIEGAELPVLDDCRDRLQNVRTLLIDLHEFDPRRRQTGALFQLLTDAGFVFDIKNLASLPSRAPQLGSPFTQPAPTWAVLVRAWRC
jgi:FkbM family methyltransferase